MQPRLPHFHPWRFFGTFTDWKLRFAALPPGTWGHSDPDEMTVTIDRDLKQAERRTTILHECGHILRGTFGHERLSEELEIDRHASRILMPSILDIADALVWSGGRHEEAAAELWVDEQMLHVRLSALLPSERELIRSRFADVHVSGSVAPVLLPTNTDLVANRLAFARSYG